MPSPAAEPLEPSPPELAALTPPGPARLVDVRVRELDCRHTFHVTTRSWEISRSDERSVQEPLRVVLWSEEPNDLESVTFVLKQSAAVPSEGTEENYRAYLRKREEEEARAAAEEERKRREREAYCAAHHEDWLGWGIGGYDRHLWRKRFFDDLGELGGRGLSLARQHRGLPRVPLKALALVQAEPPPVEERELHVDGGLDRGEPAEE